MPPATAASKFSDTPAALGQLGQCHAVMRQQRLVGGDDMFAGFQRRLDSVLGRARITADQFDEHIDAGGLRQRHRVIVPFQLGEVMATVLGLGAGRDARHNDATPARISTRAPCVCRMSSTPVPTVPILQCRA